VVCASEDEAKEGEIVLALWESEWCIKTKALCKPCELCNP
jgi:hypothetical protein